MAGVRKVKVTSDEDNMRIDRWFFKHFPGLKNSEFNKLLRKGYIRIDGKRAKNNTRVLDGQEVRVPPLDDDLSTDKKTPYYLNDKDRTFIQEHIIFEDKDLIILNKPAGLAVQGGTKSNHRNVDILMNAYSKEQRGEEAKAYLVHRLDKETSGVQILAKNRKASQIMALQFKEKSITKDYIAITRGVPNPLEGQIKAPLTKGHDRSFIDDEHGKRSLTDYEVLEHSSNMASIVKASPLTGRTHQIRVHLSFCLKTPIMGDNKYNENYLNSDDVFFEEGFNNLFLHAHMITFKHPIKNKVISIKAPLPTHFFKLSDYFGFDLLKTIA